MEKYKICPTCGTKNPPTMIECVKCETDLTGIPIGEAAISSDVEDHSAAYDVVSQNGSAKMVRICECGTKNPVSARKCGGCGEDISDIMPIPDTDPGAQRQIHYILSSLDGGFSYEMNQNLTVVGRENAMKEYLTAKAFVSRRHAEFLIEADRLWIKNHSGTNGTYVNNEIIRDNEYFELHDGDVIGLGGKELNGSLQEEAAYFRVGIGTCI